MTSRPLIGKVEKGDGLTIATVEMSQTKKAKGVDERRNVTDEKLKKVTD